MKLHYHLFSDFMNAAALSSFFCFYEWSCIMIIFQLPGKKKKKKKILDWDSCTVVFFFFKFKFPHLLEGKKKRRSYWQFFPPRKWADVFFHMTVYGREGRREGEGEADLSKTKELHNNFLRFIEEKCGFLWIIVDTI